MTRRRRAFVVGVAVLMWSATAGAHRVDEYLQATRIDIERNRINLDIDLTPGIAAAARVIEAIDLDRDGVTSATEAAAYGNTVLSSVAVEMDGRPLSIALTSSAVPSFAEMKEGVGAVRLSATAALPAMADGRHRLVVRNGHRPEMSVYLVNALVPRDAAIVIGAQQRDPQQHELQLDYRIGNDTSLTFAWGPVGAGVIAMLLADVLWRRRRTRR
jgi:hypothetical protein